MKKELGCFLVLMFSIGLVSAQGLSDILNQIDQSTVVLFGIFLVAFSLLFFALNRALKGNTAIAGVISAVISFLIVYAINRTGFDLNSYFYGWGISSDVISTIIPLIMLGVAVLLIIKLRKNSLLILGVGLIALSFFVYAQTLLIVVGAVLIIVRFLIPKGKWEMPQKRGGSYGGRSYYGGGGI